MTFKNLILASAMAVSVTALASNSASATTQTIPSHKVGICHATGSEKNPYVFIVVDKNATDAHKNHQDRRDVIGVSSASACPKTTTNPSPSPSVSPSTKPAETGGQGSGSTLGAATSNETMPTVLPDTGAGLSGLIGFAAMATATLGYIRSRRK